MNVKSIIEYYM